MSISLLNNQASLAVRREMDVSERDAHRAMERLASGTRINHVYDDPAGLAMSSLLRAKLLSLQQAQRNAMDAVSLIQVAEGGVNELDNIVGRLRELAIQASSDSVTDQERGLLQAEFSQLTQEVERIAQSTRYLDTGLLNGTRRELSFQVGIENTDNDRSTYDPETIDVTTAALGLEEISIEDQDYALDALGTIDEARARVQTPKAYLGAVQARLNSLSNFLSVYEENLSAAHGRIHDTDYARETTDLLRAQIHEKAAIAVLAQANQEPAMVLKLLDPSV